MASLITLALIVLLLIAAGRSLARQVDESRESAPVSDLRASVFPGFTRWQSAKQSFRDSWRWSLWHLSSSGTFAVTPVFVYIAAATGCWGIGHLAGVPDGTWASMLTGYGGGAALSVVLLALGVRRIGPQDGSLVEELGYGRLIAASHIKPSSEDRSGRLWRIPLPHQQELTVVEVLNSTPEADGTYKRYFLRVPSDVRTAHEAVAWTFGIERANYKPLAET